MKQSQDKKNNLADNTQIKEHKKISFLDIIAILVKRKWIIIIPTFIAAVYILTIHVLAASLPTDSPLNFAPNYYSPKVTVLLDSSSSSKSIASQISSSAANLMGYGIAPFTNPNITLLHEIMYGNKLLDKIAETFNLYEKLKLDPETDKLAVRLYLKNNLKIEYISPNPQTSPVVMFEVSFTDTDRVYATKILKIAVDLLIQEFKEVILDQIEAKKEFIEERLIVVEREYFKAQQNLIEFQQEYNVDLKTLAEEHTRYISRLQSEIYNQELQIRSLYLSENDPQIIQLRNQINQKKQLIYELKNGFYTFSEQSVPLNDIPELIKEFSSLEMEVGIQKDLYQMLRQELEKTKIEEADNSSALKIIEEAEIPLQKDGPKRALTCIIYTVTIFVITLFLAFVIEYFSSIKRDPQEKEKLKNIISLLIRKKRR